MKPLTWKQLTPKQRNLLLRACAQGINPKKEPVDETAAQALKDHGLLRKMVNQKGKVVWRSTEEGRALVASLGMRPTFLSRSSVPAYTHSASLALPGAGEVIDYGEAA